VRIVIAGASGLIGSALAPALSSGGHDVVRLVRREPSEPGEVSWDPQLRTIDTAGLQGVEAAVNLSGTTIGRRWTAARRQEILGSRVASTTLLAEALAHLEPKPRVLVCAGGIGIYGDRNDEILTEESELGGGFLAEVGRAWEAAAEPARASGIRVVSFRQGIVLSRRGGALARMLTPFKLGLGGRIGSGRQWLSWVAIDDLVAAYAFALGRDDLAGPVDLTSPNPVTNDRFVNALGHALRRPTVLPLPAFAVRTLFGEMGDAALLQGQRALPARLLEAGFEFRYGEIDSALERALAER
jgi:uncharacterized protein (TIGR01777 family)